MRLLFLEADVVIPLAALVGATLCNMDLIGVTSTNHDTIFMMIKN
jgi:hypothetical protein